MEVLRACILRRRVIVVLAALLSALVASSPSAAAAEELAGDADAAGRLRAFIEDFLPKQMVRRRVPGAAFVFVRDGRVVMSRGFGYADVARGEKFDPDTTVFPVGSLSKPVTATAVMQLWERGAIAMDADVNRYLAPPLRIAPLQRPVTMHDLLTHTAGFDPVHFGVAASTPDGVLPLHAYLASHQPARLPPGQVIQYSNFGYALAGHVVERAANQPFDRYMAEHVFRPLGMARSSFSVAAQATAAQGYDWDGERQCYVPQVRYFMHETPASGMTSTAADMGKFLLAHLEVGRGALRPQTLEVMHRAQFHHHPALPG